MLKWTGRVLLALVVLLTGAVFLLRTPDTDPVEMLAKYGGAQARFAEGAGGLRVHYRSSGDPADPAVVMLHGSNSSLHTWEPLAARLGGYHVISLDLPGHGLTGPHPQDDYSAEGNAQAVDAVLDDLGVEQAVLIGNSFGGWVSWRYALSRSERVAGLVLIASSGMPRRDDDPEPPSSFVFELLDTRVGGWLLTNITPRPLVESSLEASVSVTSIIDDAMVDRYWELIRYPGNRRAAIVSANAEREPEMADRIGEIEAPVLVIWGAEDQFVLPSAARTFAERLPQAEVVIFDGIGHLPMEEAPDRTAEAIRDFLN
ncbi:alpha/beta fold hydrolase [Pontivivens ytuae]|uniref:Alpha/beta hydrolase n=1 Tax=Pontivivens ytuae TaxID=2789856 RepID=A0A7S9LUL8_9RHOB|nr:alpha/beta hydrolase [Pontivivens ytuae]QPH55544.1 alpha/beta hydrolase [Pontivivens ytuae]